MSANLQGTIKTVTVSVDAQEHIFINDRPVNVQLLAGALSGPFGVPNVDQVLSATATARLVRKHGKVVWHRATTRSKLRAKVRAHKRHK